MLPLARAPLDAVGCTLTDITREPSSPLRPRWMAGWLAGTLDVHPSGALSRTFPTWRAATRGNNYCLIHHFSLNLPIIPELLSRLALDKSQDIRFYGQHA